jgi:hypothetical protein
VPHHGHSDSNRTLERLSKGLVCMEERQQQGTYGDQGHNAGQPAAQDLHLE